MLGDISLPRFAGPRQTQSWTHSSGRNTSHGPQNPEVQTSQAEDGFEYDSDTADCITVIPYRSVTLSRSVTPVESETTQRSPMTLPLRSAAKRELEATPQVKAANANKRQKTRHEKPSVRRETGEEKETAESDFSESDNSQFAELEESLNLIPKNRHITYNREPQYWSNAAAKLPAVRSTYLRDDPHARRTNKTATLLNRRDLKIRQQLALDLPQVSFALDTLLGSGSNAEPMAHDSSFQLQQKRLTKQTSQMLKEGDVARLIDKDLSNRAQAVYELFRYISQDEEIQAQSIPYLQIVKLMDAEGKIQKATSRSITAIIQQAEFIKSKDPKFLGEYEFTLLPPKLNTKSDSEVLSRKTLERHPQKITVKVPHSVIAPTDPSRGGKSG